MEDIKKRRKVNKMIVIGGHIKGKGLAYRICEKKGLLLAIVELLVVECLGHLMLG